MGLGLEVRLHCRGGGGVRNDRRARSSSESGQTHPCQYAYISAVWARLEPSQARYCTRGGGPSDDAARERERRGPSGTLPPPLLRRSEGRGAQGDQAVRVRSEWGARGEERVGKAAQDRETTRMRKREVGVRERERERGLVDGTIGADSGAVTREQRQVAR